MHAEQLWLISCHFGIWFEAVLELGTFLCAFVSTFALGRTSSSSASTGEGGTQNTSREAQMIPVGEGGCQDSWVSRRPDHRSVQIGERGFSWAGHSLPHGPSGVVAKGAHVRISPRNPCSPDADVVEAPAA